MRFFSRIETGKALPNAAAISALVKVVQISCGWLRFTQAELNP